MRTTKVIPWGWVSTSVIISLDTLRMARRWTERDMDCCESIVENSSDTKVLVDDMVEEGEKEVIRMTLSGISRDKTYTIEEAYFTWINDGKVLNFYSIHTESMELEPIDDLRVGFYSLFS